MKPRSGFPASKPGQRVIITTDPYKSEVGTVDSVGAKMVKILLDGNIDPDNQRKLVRKAKRNARVLNEDVQNDDKINDENHRIPSATAASVSSITIMVRDLGILDENKKKMEFTIRRELEQAVGTVENMLFLPSGSLLVRFQDPDHNRIALEKQYIMVHGKNCQVTRSDHSEFDEAAAENLAPQRKNRSCVENSINPEALPKGRSLADRLQEPVAKRCRFD